MYNEYTEMNTQLKYHLTEVVISESFCLYNLKVKVRYDLKHRHTKTLNIMCKIIYIAAF